MRLLTAVIVFTLLLGGCAENANSTKRDALGSYERCLCEAEHLEGIVKLVDEDSVLGLRLFRSDRGQLKAELRLNGSVRILGKRIWDKGHNPYPVEGLELQGRDMKGKIDIPDFFFTPHFNGNFQGNFDSLFVDVNNLGEINLKRVDDEPAPRAKHEVNREREDTADTGLLLN